MHFYIFKATAICSFRWNWSILFLCLSKTVVCYTHRGREKGVLADWDEAWGTEYGNGR